MVNSALHQQHSTLPDPKNATQTTSTSTQTTAPTSVFWLTWVRFATRSFIIRVHTRVVQFLVATFVERCLPLFTLLWCLPRFTLVTLLFVTLWLHMPTFATIPTFHTRFTLGCVSKLLGRCFWPPLLFAFTNLTQFHWLRVLLFVTVVVLHSIDPGSHENGLWQVSRVCH